MSATDADQKAAELVTEARERHEQRRAEQEAFLEAVADEEGAEVIETHVTLVEGFDVDVSVRLDGELDETLAEIEERTQTENPSASDVKFTAERAAGLLADAIDDDGYPRRLFIDTWHREGLAALGTMLKRVLEGVKAERERAHGVAEGFRPTE